MTISLLFEVACYDSFLIFLGTRPTLIGDDNVGFIVPRQKLQLQQQHHQHHTCSSNLPNWMKKKSVLNLHWFPWGFVVVVNDSAEIEQS